MTIKRYMKLLHYIPKLTTQTINRNKALHSFSHDIKNLLIGDNTYPIIEQFE